MKNLVKLSLALTLTLIAGCDKLTPEQKAQKTCEDGILSYSYARDFIKQNLKSPSTAEFPSFKEVNHKYLGNCTHNVIGVVDAQNSFGAILRNKFNVTVRYDKPKQTYYLENISIK